VVSAVGCSGPAQSIFVYSRTPHPALVALDTSGGRDVFRVPPMSGGRIYLGPRAGVTISTLRDDCSVANQTGAGSETLEIIEVGDSGPAISVDNPHAQELVSQNRPLVPIDLDCL
jgi:hypothetical protein